MDKGAIKSFAIEARKILMKSAITQAGFYGVSKDGCAQPTQKGAGFEVYRTIAGTDNRIFGDDIKRREKLVKAVEEKGFDQVIEETAYTWFNRLIAIRFMEVNGYLPTRTRVLSSETGSNTPDLMSQYMDVDLDMTMDELEKVQTCVRENCYDEAFALLFVKQCNALNEILPNLFEKTTDYMELLLKLSYTSDGVVRMLVDTIPESNFDVEQEGQIEIIGWMYQFYNIEPKAEVFSKKGKLKKEEIPAATQLFTPDWIVRYMVENSLGRLWIEGHPNEELKTNWKYYLDEASQDKQVDLKLEEVRGQYRKLNPEEIRVIDPCMGSGHILVYCFEVLMQIYESQGYTQRDAAQAILNFNLYGLDIDKRAGQLAYFAVMMKARQYDRRIFSRSIVPKVYVIEESNSFNRRQLDYFGKNLNPVERNEAKLQILDILDALHDAKEYGSVLNIEDYDWELLLRFVDSIDDDGQMTMDTIGLDESQNHLRQLVWVARTMAQKYDVTITNPPYMGVSNASPKLNEYIKKNYPDEKVDMYTVFIEKCGRMTKKNAFQAMITQHGWMFLGSFEKMRIKKLQHDIVNMAHLGARAFEEIGGEVVQTVAFVFRISSIPSYKGTYARLVSPNSQDGKETLFLQKTAEYQACKKDFENIPGSPIAYWISEQLGNAFADKLLGDYAYTKQGFATGNNDKFLRFWQEVSSDNTVLGTLKRNEALNSNYKWFPCNKGGTYRKWYGNNIYVANWEHNGKDMTAFPGSVIRNPQFYFMEGITWSSLANQLSLRYSPEGFLFESKGSMCYTKGTVNIKYLLALLNSKIAAEALSVLSPTLDFHEGPMAKVPVILTEKDEEEEILYLVDENISLAKFDWDSYEASWDFEEHPFVRIAKGLWDVTATGASMFYYYGKHIEVSCPLELCYMLWQGECNERFKQLKDNEEKLNQIFIRMYGLKNELTPEIDDEDISIRKADLSNDVRSLISYAVGCMFGRYSLDVPGLVYSGGKWSDDKYNSYQPDKDNTIPITDEEYFEDDMVGQFCNWMKIVFGTNSLEENLDFIAKALGNKGTTSREVIRNYFLNDFMKDHMKIYQKRPIYWMFDSGKQNGFKCLTYMHRYDKDTVGRVRSDYLRKSQEAIEAALKNAEYTIQNSTSAIDKATATKKRDKYIKQLSEIRTYFQALSHVALQRIDIDLDDGVKVNYEKFQNIEIVDENGKKQKINLLTKI